MKNEIFVEEKKRQISKKIKNITLDIVDDEMQQLINIGHSANTLSSRTRIGNNIVDFFTFSQRLETKGKYNISLFEFV